VVVEGGAGVEEDQAAQGPGQADVPGFQRVRDVGIRLDEGRQRKPVPQADGVAVGVREGPAEQRHRQQGEVDHDLRARGRDPKEGRQCMARRRAPRRDAHADAREQEREHEQARRLVQRHQRGPRAGLVERGARPRDAEGDADRGGGQPVKEDRGCGVMVPAPRVRGMQRIHDRPLRATGRNAKEKRPAGTGSYAKRYVAWRSLTFRHTPRGLESKS
jgi:hypothetical protein